VHLMVERAGKAAPLTFDIVRRALAIPGTIITN
jgi:hypothetical protein